MPRIGWKPLSSTATLAISAFIAATIANPAQANHVPAGNPIKAEHGAQVVIPMMNPERGKRVFIDKGCVACHAINGVGGHDAPPMDAHRQMGLVNPFDFAAKMWNHAPAMIAAQEGAFGEQIYFTGSELAEIIAFVYDDATQHEFRESDLTAKAHKMMEHEHGNMPAVEAHAKEVGHGGGHTHESGTPEHSD